MNIAKVLMCLALAGIVGLTPTAQADLLLDNGSIANGSGRTVSGIDIAGGWMVFQPFTVPEPGWNVETIGTDGWSVLDPMGLGMLGTLLPDTGANYPDEANPIGNNVYYLGNDAWNPNWRDEPFDVALPAGHYWMRWSDNGDRGFWAAIFPGVTGENSFSRSGNSDYGSGPTALRIYGTEIPEPGTICLLLLGVGALLRRK